MSHPTKNRFKRNRIGAAYPLLPDEILQARAPLTGSSGDWGRFFLRITQHAHCEKAEYWFDGDRGFTFTSRTDKLQEKAMRRVLQALEDLVKAMGECHQPEVSADDSGRSIVFWDGSKPVSVFIPGNPVSYQPSMPCFPAFEGLWSILTDHT